MFEKNDYWFQPKRYGYGLTPISWEGWLITAFFALCAIPLALVLLHFVYPPMLGTVLFVALIILSSFLLLRLTKSRTKGVVQWNWGNTTQEKK